MCKDLLQHKSFRIVPKSPTPRKNSNTGALKISHFLSTFGGALATKVRQWSGGVAASMRAASSGGASLPSKAEEHSSPLHVSGVGMLTDSEVG